MWRSLIRQLFAAGALEETGGEHPGLRLTGKGEAILFGRERILAFVRSAQGRAE